jgi:hypothetical protein
MLKGTAKLLISCLAKVYSGFFTRFRRVPVPCPGLNTLPDSCDIPSHVDDDEDVFRIVKRPAHLKKRSGDEVLKIALFKSKPGTDDVSVMRELHMGRETCCVKALETAKEYYAGYAIVKTSSVRSAGSQVLDSRSEFCGHAHILHGVIFQPNEPPPPEVLDRLNARLDTILKSTRFYPASSQAGQG